MKKSGADPEYFNRVINPNMMISWWEAIDMIHLNQVLNEKGWIEITVQCGQDITDLEKNDKWKMFAFGIYWISFLEWNSISSNNRDGIFVLGSL